MHGKGSFAKLREKLGESLSTVQKFDTPLEQATTPLSRPLQAYSLGRKAFMRQAEFAAAVPFFQRAVGLDPNFAMAYAMLGPPIGISGESILALRIHRKAYELRDRVSEERSSTSSLTSLLRPREDMEKARQAYELWAQTYPRDQVPPSYLAGYLP